MQSTLPNAPQTPPVNLLPTQPLGVGEIIDRSFRLYRRHFKVFFFTSAIVILPLALLTGFFTQSAMQGQLSMLQGLLSEGAQGIESFDDLATLNSTSAGLQILLSLASLVGYFLTFLALTTLAIRTLRGSEASVSLAWKGARSFFWPGLRMGILYILAIIGVTIGVMIVVVILSLLGAGIFGGLMSAFDSGGDSAVAAIGVILVLCCLMPLFFALVLGPYVYLGARWYVATPVLIDQESGAREALRTSWQLTKGSILRVIGFLVLIYILSIILLALPVYMVQFISILVAGTQSVWVAAVLSTLFATLLNILWSPLSAIFAVLLYFDLRLRQSGGDIGSRLDRLEASLEQPNPNTPPFVYSPPPVVLPVDASTIAAAAETPPPSAPTVPSSWNPVEPPPNDPTEPGTE
jgi:hypothetical protein